MSKNLAQIIAESYQNGVAAWKARRESNRDPVMDRIPELREHALRAKSAERWARYRELVFSLARNETIEDSRLLAVGDLLEEIQYSSWELERDVRAVRQVDALRAAVEARKPGQEAREKKARDLLAKVERLRDEYRQAQDDLCLAVADSENLRELRGNLRDKELNSPHLFGESTGATAGRVATRSVDDVFAEAGQSVGRISRN